MIIAGIILIILAVLLGIHIFWILGIALVVIALVLMLAAGMGHAAFGRRHYW